ncbi:nucleotidyltransferase family protein [Aneurinibacillus aneurinilyticus]|nr:nucleotidyltransferase family protein [Aneurinibacillus aneurinilyticus]MED0670739.1 nucleotidyltransferase family protein [Aneurinibacillus aneurinilyticus]MED0709842.1 nucleotidyltransferase family protein [Aneurinibacillus aneurinilyticus]MED0726114.1 nucleotidyltransferase family protein [Aneurinibacillus aneurinilyticus]MED0733619.1 nucleotidyltransferase family protein [Aneurinibacillus aneurinilyticus]MED0744130.1 nucleotidyltransferase family protein [Aneurinibacillus aneurinilyticu
MMIKNHKDIIDLVQNDDMMMKILNIVKFLKLPDCWICAGIIRNRIWDALHHFEEPTMIEDVDVIYFDSNSIDEKIDKSIEERLYTIHPNINWSVKNQARMHKRNGDDPYKSTEDAVSKFPETATAIAVRLNEEDNVDLITPCGIEDLVNLIVRPTKHFLRNANTKAKVYEDRLQKKKWQEKWDKLAIIHMDF